MTDLDRTIRQAKNGDKKAFEDLMINYEKLIYNIALGYLKNPEDAAEMAQEALLKAYKNMFSFNGTSFKSWLCAITVNTCIDELRKRKKMQLISMDDTGKEDAVEKQYPSSEPTPEEALVNKERSEEIRSAINKLSDEYKTLIILRDMQDLSYEELSRVTGLKAGTVKSRLSRARQALRKILT